FNLLLARFLYRRGIPVFYFISPQIWAWRSGRVKTMKRFVKKVATIFPFEETFYHRHGVEAQYVGHPLLSVFPVKIDRETFLRRFGLEVNGAPLVALLPGSRKAEISELLPPMLQAVKKLRLARPGLQAVVPIAPGVDPERVRAIAGEYASEAAF